MTGPIYGLSAHNLIVQTWNVKVLFTSISHQTESYWLWLIPSISRYALLWIVFQFQSFLRWKIISVCSVKVVLVGIVCVRLCIMMSRHNVMIHVTTHYSNWCIFLPLPLFSPYCWTELTSMKLNTYKNKVSHFLRLVTFANKWQEKKLTKPIKWYTVKWPGNNPIKKFTTQGNVK